MKDIFRHLFTPQKSNNHRAKILHNYSLFVLAVFLFAGSFLVSAVRVRTPQVLGASIDISSNQLLLLTNQKRLANGDLPLQLNEKLENAASAKANDMFARDYWAHNGPNGETPWSFIKKAGYDYTYAGENLARGFTSAQDVVSAWMASPEHRANMLSANYQDVGFTVRSGLLQGEKTVLVVEMFGGTKLGGGISSYTNNQPTSSQANPSSQVWANSFLDSSSLTKDIVLLILGIFIVTLFLDQIYVKRKNIVRFVGHNIDHMLFFAVLFIMVLIVTQALVL